MDQELRKLLLAWQAARTATPPFLDRETATPDGYAAHVEEVHAGLKRLHSAEDTLGSWIDQHLGDVPEGDQAEPARAAMSHTQGPWEYAGWGLGPYGGPCVIASVDGRESVVATCWVAFGMTRDQAIANARLIAAAPALLAACKDLLYVPHVMMNAPGSMIGEIRRDAEAKAQAAIAKAEGEGSANPPATASPPDG